MDVPCSTTGLTPREKEKVQAAWNLIKHDLKGFGVALLKSYFDANPSYLHFFKDFKDVPLNDLPGNSRFQAHSLSVVTRMNSMVGQLNDPTVLLLTLKHLGETHGKRNVEPKHFQDLKIALLKQLKTKLGSNFSDEAAKAFERMMNAAFSIVFPALEIDGS